MQLKTLMPDIYTLIPSDYASIRCREYERLLSLYMSRAVPSAHPRFVQVGGIPGAGKSTFCAGRRWNDRLFISFDAIMENIPAYQTDIYRLGRAGSFKNGKFRLGLSVMNCSVAPLKPGRTFILSTAASTGRIYSWSKI